MGWSRTKLSVEVGININAICAWEQNRSAMSHKSRCKFEERFGWDPIEKFGVSKTPLKIHRAKRPGPPGLKVDGNGLKQWRLELGLTQHQAATMGGWGLNIFSNWERELKGLTFESRMKFKKVWGFDPVKVFRHKEVTDDELYNIG